MARRRYGTGSLWQRPDGRWVAQVTVRRDGRRHFVTRIRRSQEAARAALDDLRRTAAGQRLPAHQTVGGYAATWLVTIKPSVAPRSFSAYRDRLRLHIEPLLGGILLDALRPADVARLVDACLAVGLAPVTTGAVLDTLSAIMEAALREGLVIRNVVRLVRRPRAERRIVAPVTVAHARRLLAAVADDAYGPFFTLLLGSGLRSGEACALDWADVDLDGATVRVRAGKTARARRTVPIAGFAVTALRAQRARSGRIDGPVFLGQRSGQRLTRTAAYDRFGLLLERAGLPPMRVHDLRHAAATLLLATWMDMRYLADQLGHANPATTSRIYAHVIPELQRAALRRLDEVVG